VVAPDTGEKFAARDGKLAGKLGDGDYVAREKSELARPKSP
jgi:hypothetical protein